MATGKRQSLRKVWTLLRAFGIAYLVSILAPPYSDIPKMAVHDMNAT